MSQKNDPCPACLGLIPEMKRTKCLGCKRYFCKEHIDSHYCKDSWTSCKICKKMFEEGDYIISLPLWYPNFKMVFGHLKCVQNKVKEEFNKISLKTLKKYLVDNNWEINKFSDYLDKAIYLDPQKRFINTEIPFTMFPKSDNNYEYISRLSQIIQTLSVIMNISEDKIRGELLVREFAGN